MRSICGADHPRPCLSLVGLAVRQLAIAVTDTAAEVLKAGLMATGRPKQPKLNLATVIKFAVIVIDIVVPIEITIATEPGAISVTEPGVISATEPKVMAFSVD